MVQFLSTSFNSLKGPPNLRKNFFFNFFQLSVCSVPQQNKTKARQERFGTTFQLLTISDHSEAKAERTKNPRASLAWETRLNFSKLTSLNSCLLMRATFGTQTRPSRDIHPSGHALCCTNLPLPRILGSLRPQNASKYSTSW